VPPNQTTNWHGWDKDKEEKERKEQEPIPEEGMEWMNKEWGGEVKEEKRKPEIDMKSSQKRRKLEPLVEREEATSNPAPCVRTWLLQDTILEEESGTDRRQKTTSAVQMPSSKMRQSWTLARGWKERILIIPGSLEKQRLLNWQRRRW
jgi:hypothetical protein